MRELGDKSGVAESLASLGNVACSQGDYTLARSLFEQSLALMRELEDKKGVAVNLAALGALAAKRLDGQRAVKLLGSADTMLQAIGAILSPAERSRYDEGMASGRSQLGEAPFEEISREGQAMSIEAAIEYALLPSANNSAGQAGDLLDGTGQRQRERLDDELHLKIDQTKKALQVEAITGTDYFRELQAKVTSLRSRS